jgi:peptidoglycan-associated lipoprotein
MRTTTMLMTGALVLVAAGCAHEQKPQTEVTVKDEPKAETPPASPQMEVTAPKNDEGAAELDEVLRSTRVYFDFDRDALKPEGMAALQKMATVLRKHPGLKVRIEGHCDERGTEEYNLLLGERRATVAQRYLADLGVPSTQLDTISYGDNRPLSEDHTEAAWAKNRRDDVIRKNN